MIPQLIDDGLLSRMTAREIMERVSAEYRTRIAAGALAIFSLAAAAGFHHNLADLDQFIHFLKNVAIAGGLLQVVAFGAGTFSLDAYRRGKVSFAR